MLSHSAVDAASIMITGASITREIGSTIDPQAASCVRASGNRAITALVAGNATAISNQDSPSGHHRANTSRIESDPSGSASIVLATC